MKGNDAVKPLDPLIAGCRTQADGRITNVELASRGGFRRHLFAPRTRVEEQGFVRGYHADVDSRQLGFEVSALPLGCKVRQGGPKNLKTAALWPLVRECHMLNGEVDFYAKVRGAGSQPFQFS